MPRPPTVRAASPAPSGAREPVPLAVWPCAQRSPEQHLDRYLPASRQHPGRMLPELARLILTAYSQAGDLVCDPMCGIGTTLVEAAALRRRGMGVEVQPRWAGMAAANLTHALSGRQRGLAAVQVGDARRLPDLLGMLAGTVDLILTAPPAADNSAIDQDADGVGRAAAQPDDHVSSASRDADLGQLDGQGYLAALAQVYAGCHQTLRAGGLLVVVTQQFWQHGRLVDLAGTAVALARRAGFGYTQHVIAVCAAISGDQLVVTPNRQAAWSPRRSAADSHHVVAHQDVLVFRKPGTGDA